MRCQGNCQTIKYHIHVINEICVRVNNNTPKLPVMLINVNIALELFPRENDRMQNRLIRAFCTVQVDRQSTFIRSHGSTVYFTCIAVLDTWA